MLMELRRSPSRVTPLHAKERGMSAVSLSAPGLPLRFARPAARSGPGAERLLSLLEQMPAFMWTTDRELRITDVHGDAARLEGLAAVGQSVFERWGDAGAVGAIALHERALAGESFENECTFAGRTLQSRLEPLRDEAGQVVGAIGVALDVTDRRRA